MNSFSKFFLLFFSCLLLNCNAGAQTQFISIKDHVFFNGLNPQYFIGTNYWYGGLLGLLKDNEKGLGRLRGELDFLKEQGITNLRILAGPEGTGVISGVNRVKPPLQLNKAIFDSTFLYGLDVLLSEMRKRKMKAVLILSNNWEWSGGFLQYLAWNGIIPDSVLRRTLNWDEYRDYVSRFYSCGGCQEDYFKKVDYILNHQNSVTNINYTDDPVIMSWELANEPRPMRPEAVEAYKKWISAAAAHIRAKDKNHLITIGTEGYIGTENADTYESIHADKNIDYLTIHIWPKNWDWYNGDHLAGGMDSVVSKTKNYIAKHEAIARKLNKPLVIEEFGLPRDNHSFTPGSATHFRDGYYELIINSLIQSRRHGSVLGGINFWSYGGAVVPEHERWQDGDDYIGDPPMEEQGLNAVFNRDHSTWKTIKTFVEKK